MSIPPANEARCAAAATDYIAMPLIYVLTLPHSPEDNKKMNKTKQKNHDDKNTQDIML